MSFELRDRPPDTQALPAKTDLVAVWAWIWLGVVVGISMIATPAKFSAGSLDLATALDIGRTTFRLFGLMQWGALAILAGLVFSTKPANNVRRLLTVGVALILILQAVWILPALYDRVDIVMAGDELEGSPIHFIFAVFEGTKIILLALIGLGGKLPRRRAA